MHHDQTAKEAGVIEAVFAHRFVLRRQDGTTLLADIGPKGAEIFPLVAGATVSIEGDRKPSEIKVARITPAGGATVVIAHGKPHEKHAEIDVAHAIAAVKRAGLDPVGAPRRKPKHVEVLARRGDHLVEVHVERAGGIRKEKPVPPDGGTWADTLDAPI